MSFTASSKSTSVRSAFPTISDTLIRPEDIEVWVTAAAKATLKALTEEESVKEPISKAVKVHEDLLIKTVSVMCEGMNKNTETMSTVIANQGRLFIGMGLCGFIMGDKDLSRKEKIGYTLLGLGVLGVVDRLVNNYSRV